MLVNPGGNPFSSGLVRETWRIFKSMGGRSPALDPDIWRRAFDQARAELGPKAFHGWYDNPIWVRGYTRRHPKTGAPIHVRPYARLTPSEIKALTGGVPVYRLRAAGGPAYDEYERRKARILEEFVHAYPSPAAWEAAGRPRMEELVMTANPFVGSAIRDVWAEFKRMGGRSPALDPELWAQAFHKVQAREPVVTGWYSNPPVPATVSRYLPLLEGMSIEDVLKLALAGIAGFWASNYLPKLTKWETGWQGVIATLVGAAVAGYAAYSFLDKGPRASTVPFGLAAFLGGLINATAKALNLASGGRISVIAGAEIGAEEEDELLKELLSGEEVGEEGFFSNETTELITGEDVGATRVFVPKAIVMEEQEKPVIPTRGKTVSLML